MKRPRVRVQCVADRYAGSGERIVEFSGRTAEEGGLIAFRYVGDKLCVEVYRQGRAVEVSVGKPEGQEGGAA